MSDEYPADRQNSCQRMPSSVALELLRLIPFVFFTELAVQENKKLSTRRSHACARGSSRWYEEIRDYSLDCSRPLDLR